MEDLIVWLRQVWTDRLRQFDEDEQAARDASRLARGVGGMKVFLRNFGRAMNDPQTTIWTLNQVAVAAAVLAYFLGVVALAQAAGR